jgi:hypothetical protein
MDQLRPRKSRAFEWAVAATAIPVLYVLTCPAVDWFARAPDWHRVKRPVWAQRYMAPYEWLFYHAPFGRGTLWDYETLCKILLDRCFRAGRQRPTSS